jgi:shikimate kinase
VNKVMINDFDPSRDAQMLRRRLKTAPLVLVGLMGCGKSALGKRLAQYLNLNFVDSDAEIEQGTGLTIPEIFEIHGEPYFRALEVRVIARLLARKNVVLATGGGAFMNAETHERLKNNALTLWLEADLELTFKRVSKRANRPLLKTANPKQTLQELMDKRYPIYKTADIHVISRDVPHDEMLESCLIGIRMALGLQKSVPHERA